MIMKKFLIYFSFIPFISFSQDIIIKKDGLEIESIIIEINNSEIKFKKISNLEGPLFVLDKTEISQIKYKNGEIDIFQKTNDEVNKEYIEREKNNISSIFIKGNKVYIEKAEDANEDALGYFKSSLENWGYWSIVENKSDADFIIIFSLKKKIMADRQVKATLKTLNNKLYLETKSYTASATAFNGYNGSRAATNKLVEKYFAKKFR